VFVFENTKEFQNYIKQYDDNKVTMWTNQKSKVTMEDLKNELWWLYQ
jgi:hypothetical protein